MPTLLGRLTSTRQGSFAGHEVLGEFTAKVKVGVGDATEELEQALKSSGNADSEGHFELVLPDEGEFSERLDLSVRAPDGELLETTNYTFAYLERQTQDFEDEFELRLRSGPKEYSELPDDDPPFLGPLKGAVVDKGGKKIAHPGRVILWGRLEETRDEEDYRPLLITEPEPDGSFRGPYPRGRFDDAYGEVLSQKIAIPIEDTDREDNFPERVLLLVEVAEAPEDAKELCACEEETPRAPDIEDLISSPATYTTDLVGGKCIELNTPNRALEEFDFYKLVRTTEPEIKGTASNGHVRIPPKFFEPLPHVHWRPHVPFPIPTPSPGPDPGPNLPGSPLIAGPGRPNPSGGGPNPAAPNPGATATLEEFPAALLRSVKPAILKSLARDPSSLTAGRLVEAAELSVFDDVVKALDVLKHPIPGRARLNADNPVDWDDEPNFYQAATIAHGHILHFKQVWKADGYSLGDLLYSLPLAPCQKKQIAVFDWDRQQTAARTERLEAEERLDSILSRDRDISEIVNSTLRENMSGGSHSQVGAVGGGLGLAIAPLVLGAGGGYSTADTTAWQDSSRSLAAGSLNQLRDRTMQASSAVRGQRSTVVQTVAEGESVQVVTEVVANHNHCHAITVEYFEVLRHLQVYQELVDVQECLFVPLLMSKFDNPKVLRWRDILQRGLQKQTLAGGFDAIERIQSNYEGSDLPPGRYSQELVEDIEGELRMTFQFARPRDSQDQEYEETNWDAYKQLLQIWGIDANAVFNRYFAAHPTPAERDRIFQQDVAPRIAEAFVQALKFYFETPGGRIEVPVDATLVSRYTPGTPLYVSLRLRGDMPAIAREDVEALVVDLPKTQTQYTLGLVTITIDPISLPPNSKVMVQSGSLRYRTKYMSNFLFRDAWIANDIGRSEPVRVSTPLSREELRDPRQEDRELARKLTAHLNEHLERYHRAIWLWMDPERRYMLIDGFEAPNSNGRSVASVIENRLIAIVGNCLVFPVAPGFQLDPTFQSECEGPVDLLKAYAPASPIPPARVSIPTKGVFAESIMGHCNSCEQKDDSLFWRFEESPCGDEPTPIEAISTESRRGEQPDLTAKDLPAPIINLQNAPPAPDPTGLVEALRLIGTPNLFRDITGIEGTQRNALAALMASLDTAKAFGSDAAKLAQQKSMTQDIDKTLRTIKDAEQGGVISSQTAGELTERALRGVVGDLPPEEHVTDVPEVKEVLKQAAGRKGRVSVRDGSESVEVDSGTATSIEFEVPGVVPPLQQPSVMTCWATVATMLLSWRDQQSYTIDEAMNLAGPKYKKLFDERKGLRAADHEDFAAALGFVSEPPMSYSVARINELLVSRGPLVAIADESPGNAWAIHARVITGMFGDGGATSTSLRINDPASGKSVTERFDMFMRKFEEVAQSPRVQIMHL
jgi:hypothetical protein